MIALAVLIVFGLGLTSAYYTCPDGTNINSDIKDIGIGQKKSVNGIPLGLARSDQAAAINRLDAELFVDAQIATLFDNNSVLITFTGENQYNVTLINSTAEEAGIKIGGSEKVIEGGQIDSIGDFDVILIRAEGNYPGIAEVEVMIGKDKVSLSNKDSISKIVAFEGRDYGVELFSASDDNALIKVSKCLNVSTELIWTEDEVENITVNDTGEQNETINETGNETNGTENILNESSNESELNGTGNDGVVGENQEKSVIPNFVFYIIIGIITIIIFLLIARYVKGKTVPDNGQDEG